jgi:parallel beta-helix repeat protein
VRIPSAGGPSLARGERRNLVVGLLAIGALIGAGLLYTETRPAVETAHLPPEAPAYPPATSATAVPSALPCGGPLTSQSQVRSNTSYCGGHATSQVILAPNDTWVNGEVSGASAGQQRGAVECADNCTLVNMNIHDNPNAFTGIRILGNNIKIIGGRVTGSGSLGIGGGTYSPLLINGVEIDHNGASANCGFEGGGVKLVVSHSLLENNYIHDNNCPGIWYDIDSANNEIAHNRIVNNADEGIFYEISQDASIHDNTVTGNGFKTNGNGCAWLWGGGITIASSFNVNVYSNTLTNNCNGITMTQQNRGGGRILANDTVHNNSIAGSGKTGVVADNGADLTTRNIVFANNSSSGGSSLCGFNC